MTSIAGWLFDEEAVVRPEQCERMFGALPAFGPLTVRQSGQAVFGRSLSPRLAEDAYDQQPLEVGNRYFLVADIRLDNRDALLPELGIARPSGTVADSEILLAAWARWGEAALGHIVGDFAFAVYDRVEKSLTLARDCTGQRPLFYAHRGGQLCFASMPSGILAASLVPPQFNREWLATKWNDVTPIGSATAFVDVHRVESGEVVKFIASSLRRSIYWQPGGEPLTLSDEAFVEEYKAQFEQAVAARMRRSTGRLGTYLSSGFDSSVVTVTAAELDHRSPPIAYTGAPVPGFDGDVPRDRIGDESGIAAETAAMHGLEHRIVHASGHPFAALRRDSRMIQEPDRNIVNMDWFTEILFAARQDGVSTMLSGALGNLTIHFGGLAILADWRRQEGYRAWARQAYRARNIPGVRATGILYNSFSDRMPLGLTRALHRSVGRDQAPAGAVFLRQEWHSLAARQKAAEHRQLVQATSFDARLAVVRSQDSGLFNLGALALTGVDERDPTADQRLIAFGFRLPPGQTLKDGVARPLMRRANAARLPPTVLDNRFRGLQSPDWHDHIRQSDARTILDEVRSSVIVEEMLDLDKLQHAIDHWPEGNWHRSDVTTVYRRAIPLTLSIAVFVQEFEAMIRANDFTFSYA